MSERKVINFQEAKARRALKDELEIVDTHDAVLDISNVVFTTDELVDTMDITDDYIIVKLDD